jgi:hypothetical protein
MPKQMVRTAQRVVFNGLPDEMNGRTVRVNECGVLVTPSGLDPQTYGGTVNVPATGDIDPKQARRLAHAILHAADLAEAGLEAAETWMKEHC